MKYSKEYTRWSSVLRMLRSKRKIVERPSSRDKRFWYNRGLTPLEALNEFLNKP